MQKSTRAISIVILLNFLYFFVEFYYARRIGSVALFADSIDFLEDATTNFIALIALNLSYIYRKYISYFLLLVFLLPAISAFILIIDKLINPIPPEAFTLTYVALGALMINALCSFLLSKLNYNQNSLLKTIYLSARNDVFSNLLIITAGLITLIHPSFIYDLLAGSFILVINLLAVKEILSDIKENKI
jgi:Co/Zn/Cd efflux system component